MKKIILLICLALLSAFAGANTSSKGTSQTDSTNVLISSNFGYIDDSDPNNTNFIKASIVPYKIGQTFGWMIQINPEIKKIKIREEFTLPEKPATWGDPSDTRTISADGRTATTEQEVTLDDGAFARWWTISEGDAKGNHVIRIFINDKLVKVFEFEISNTNVKVI